MININKNHQKNQIFSRTTGNEILKINAIPNLPKEFFNNVKDMLNSEL